MAMCPECGKHEMKIVQMKNGRFRKACAGGKEAGGCGYIKLISKAEAEKQLGTQAGEEPEQPATGNNEPPNGEGNHEPEDPRKEPERGILVRVADFISDGLTF